MRACLAQCVAHSLCSVDSRWLTLTLAQACVVVYLSSYWLACWEKTLLCSEVFRRPAGRWWVTQLLCESLRCFSVLISVFCPPRGPKSTDQKQARSFSWGPGWRDGAIRSTRKRRVLRPALSWKSILTVDPKKILPGFVPHTKSCTHVCISRSLCISPAHLGKHPSPHMTSHAHSCPALW